MKKGLFALALGTFTLGIAEFIIEGIITDIAHNMNVSIPEAGHLISIYALGVCAGAFSLILMHKYRPKNILMFLASLITFGAVIASVAPNYWLLLCARFIEGLPHGAYFGTGTIVAVKIAKEGKGTNAVAMMCAGMPVANLLGVPVGTFLSHMFSWRVPFVSCIVLGLITLYMIHRWVPDVEALPNNGMKAQFHFPPQQGSVAHHRRHLPGQWRHPLLVQLYLAAASDGGRIQRSQHLSADDSCRRRNGSRQSGECLACRPLQAGPLYLLSPVSGSSGTSAHLLPRPFRLGICGADVHLLRLSFRHRIA